MWLSRSTANNFITIRKDNMKLIISTEEVKKALRDFFKKCNYPVKEDTLTPLYEYDSFGEKNVFVGFEVEMTSPEEDEDAARKGMPTSSQRKG